MDADSGPASGPARTRRKRREPDRTELAASLRRTLAGMVRRLECHFAEAEGEVEERHVKALAALAATFVKVMELETDAGTPLDSETAGRRPGGGDLPDEVRDALEALVDGRAAGLARLS